MIELTSWAIGGLILCALIVWSVSKINRRKTAKKNLKANGYVLTFL